MSKFNNNKRYQQTGNASNLIQDLNDTTRALSVQMFIDNAVNPCLDGTFRLFLSLNNSIVIKLLLFKVRNRKYVTIFVCLKMYLIYM